MCKFIESQKVGKFDLVVHDEPSTGYYRGEVAIDGRVIEVVDTTSIDLAWAGALQRIKEHADNHGHYLPACMASRCTCDQTVGGWKHCGLHGRTW